MKDSVDGGLYAKEAEQAVVAALFSEQGVTAFDTLALFLKADDFYFEQHKIVFSAFAELVQRGVHPDATTLSTHIKASAGFTALAGRVISQALGWPYAIENIEQYGRSISEKSTARHVTDTLRGIISRAPLVGGTLTSQDLLSEVDQVSLGIDKKIDEIELLQPTTAVLAKALQRLEDLSSGKIVGTRTGIDELDSRLGGMMAGDLVVIAARPGMGKSAFALDIVAHDAIHAIHPDPNLKPISAVFSLEMQQEKLVFRFLSNMGSIDHDHLRKSQLNDDEYVRLTEALGHYEDSGIALDCSPMLTIGVMRGKLRKLVKKSKRPLGLIVVDYIQLMQSDSSRNDNRATEVGEFSRGLKLLAKEFGCPVIALSQLNRSVEQRADKRPMMSDLRESGAIEQDADIIMFIYRDEYYHPDTKSPGEAEINIAKARDGGSGVVRTLWQGHYQRFSNLDAASHSYESKYGAGK
jgi:replicative DNA helicase